MRCASRHVYERIMNCMNIHLSRNLLLWISCAIYVMPNRDPSTIIVGSDSSYMLFDKPVLS
jgi:hypothetical protein